MLIVLVVSSVPIVPAFLGMICLIDMRPEEFWECEIWRLETIMQVSSLHACVDDFRPPEAGDVTVLYVVGLLHQYLLKHATEPVLVKEPLRIYQMSTIDT